MTFQAGIYPDMDEATYFADPVPGGSLSSTGARKLLPPSCPALYRWEQDHPVRKADFDYGSAAHKLVLGAGPRLAVIDHPDWRTKAAREARDEARAAGHTPVLAGDYAHVHAMAAAIRRHPVASVLFDPGRGGSAEQSLFWPAGDIWKRARLDWLPMWGGPGRLVIPDYKTCVSADPGKLARAVADYGYHQQADFYLEGVRALGLAGDPAFIFVCQEKTPPYLVTVIQPDEDAMHVARARNDRAAEIYRDCTEAGVWPAHSDDVELISLPPWAARTEET